MTENAKACNGLKTIIELICTGFLGGRCNQQDLRLSTIVHQACTCISQLNMCKQLQTEHFRFIVNSGMAGKFCTNLCDNIHVIEAKILVLCFQKCVLISTPWYHICQIHSNFYLVKSKYDNLQRHETKIKTINFRHNSALHSKTRLKYKNTCNVRIHEPQCSRYLVIHCGGIIILVYL